VTLFRCPRMLTCPSYQLPLSFLSLQRPVSLYCRPRCLPARFVRGLHILCSGYVLRQSDNSPLLPSVSRGFEESPSSTSTDIRTTKAFPAPATVATVIRFNFQGLPLSPVSPWRLDHHQYRHHREAIPTDRQIHIRRPINRIQSSGPWHDQGP